MIKLRFGFHISRIPLITLIVGIYLSAAAQTTTTKQGTAEKNTTVSKNQVQSSSTAVKKPAAKPSKKPAPKTKKTVSDLSDKKLAVDVSSSFTRYVEAKKSIHKGTDIPIDSILAQRPVAVIDLIRGTISGTKIISADGAPGTAIDVLIRGQSSVRGDLQPLYILDGVMLNSSQLDVQNSWATIDGLDYQSTLHVLYGINPQDIESIEVLKGSSATAIYGVKGANGVISIRTKVGDKYDRMVTFTSNMGISLMSNKKDYLTGDEYQKYYQSLTNTSFSTIGKKETDWQSIAFKPAFTTNNNLSLSGSIKSTDYHLGFNFRKENGLVPGTFAQDASIRVNLDQEITSRSKFGARFVLDRNTTLSTQSTYYLGGSSLSSQISAVPFTNSGENPLSWINNYYDQSTSWRVIPQAYGQFLITDNLFLEVNGGFDVLMKQRLRWMGSDIDRGAIDNGRAGRGAMDAYLYNADAQLNYKKKLGENTLLNINASGGTYGDMLITILSKGYNYSLESLKAYGLSYGEGIPGKDVRTIYSSTQTSSYFASLNGKLSYKNYDIKGGVRADKMIDYDKTPLYYPFANGTWKISEEDFWKNAISPKIISDLSISLGWGISGKSNVKPYTQVYDYTLGQSTVYVPYQEMINYKARVQADINEYNATFLFKALNNRISGELTGYYGNAVDMLSVYNFTPDNEDNSGNIIKQNRGVYWQNRMKMERKGIEFSLKASVYKNKNIQWDATGNISFNKLTVTDCGLAGQSRLGSTGVAGILGKKVGVMDAQILNATAFINGRAPSVFYGYKTEGILWERHVAQTPPFKGTRLHAGDIKFIDVNQDGQIDDMDKVVIGDPNPDFIFSFGTSVRYGAFSLAAGFDGSYGNDILNLNRIKEDNVSLTSNVRNDAYSKSWSTQMPTNLRPKIGGFGMNEITDRLVEDGSFLRFSSLSLSYNVPVKKIKMIHSLNISLSATNLFVLTRYQGYDPDVNSFAGDWSIRGVDLGSYPRARNYSIGFIVKL